ncbi:MAG: Asp-tRNA(Asn)/Glu-tRNA(Gln) amidotransferase subunit GatC [Candidatus Zambryskibacteria bacterium]|nr:Asp-tRNA(Asn)/Glu-tRNA(Gln) amidotransferase subunit GatC [Candidatus Zambryskibacteria bacterium]
MIEKKDIEKLALLARIEVSDSEKDSLASSIESILAYVGQVTSVSESVAQGLPTLRNVMREDEVRHVSGEYTEDLLALSPERDGIYVAVKKILN